MPRRRWINWAGNLICDCEVETPANLDELKRIVVRAAGERKRVRACGGGFSWSELVPTDGVIVDMRRFDRIQRVGASPAQDPAPGTARILEVGAGATVRDLDRFARAQGLTLVSPPLFPRPTVGGAVAVGCHGTSFATGNFCDQLRELSFVLADGTERTIARGDREFPAAMVSLGTFGVLHSVKLESVPKFNVYLDKRYVPVHYVLEEFDDLIRSSEFLEIFWFPFSRKMWLYQMNTTKSPSDGWWGLTRLRDQRDRFLEQICNHVFPWVARAAPRLMPLVNRSGAALANDVSASVQTASDAFHFLNTYPKAYDTCYAVPLEHAGEAWRRAVALVDEYTRAELYPVNLALHCRFTGASTAWLAPNYGEACCFIEVTTVTKTPRWQAFFQQMEEQWATLPRARPHWGKVFHRFRGLRARYPRMNDFLGVRERWDPERVFLNRFLEEDVFRLPRRAGDRRSRRSSIRSPVVSATPAPPGTHAPRTLRGNGPCRMASGAGQDRAMRCAACQQQNDANSRFCESCGAPLPRACRSCGGSLSWAARFCRHCGAEQAASAPPSRPSRRATGHLSGERRQLTAMFCDLVGSTDLGQRVDPEELRETLSAYQDACTRAIRRFDGHVAQYLGDGLLAYFGYPQAHEDDAERAVRAALAIRSNLEELNQQRAEAGADPILARFGIHTGLVIVVGIGDPEHQETLAVGDTINVAARIQALAGSGGILVSETTQRLVAGLFAMRDLGAAPLKGVSEPVRVYAVEGTSGVYSRFRVTRALTPLRGRDSELAELADRWNDAVAGRGQVVTISGEAGIGKSRLLHEFRQVLDETTHFTLELACSWYTAGSAFQPVLELLEVGLGFSDRDTPEAKLSQLEERLGALPDLRLEEVVPYLGVLLELPSSERFPLEHMAPELQREKTLEALLAPIRALAARQTLLLLCEDLHWSDPSTLELLGRLIDDAPKLPILVLATFREGFAPPRQIVRPHVRPVRLTRLTKGDTRAVVEAAAGGEGKLPGGVLDQIAERADGVPLFAEELARAVAESGPIVEREGRFEIHGRISELRIPATLQDSLMARLDRLSEAKAVAQLCATLGSDFSHALIEVVAGSEIPGLNSGLEQLVGAEILQRQGTPPDANYSFRHSLLQSTAYESLLKSARRSIHARIAAILEERFPQRVAAEPELMAWHCAEAGLARQSVTYYQQAGERAVARLANAEAVEYTSRALELLETLPESQERRLKEIELRLAQVGRLAALHGYEHPDTVRSCERTERLCDAIVSGPEQLPGLLGLTLYHLNRGHLPKARQCAESLLRVAEPLGASSLRVSGHMIKGTTSITTATAAEACDDLRKAIEIAGTAELEPPASAHAVDALTIAYCTYAIALVLAGKLESAMEASDQGLRRARELGHPRTRGSALANCAQAFYLMEDAGRTGALAEESLEAVAGRGFHTIECSARVLRGWAHARQGDPRSTADLEEGLALASTSGTVVSQFHFVAANAYAIAGQFDRARAAFERGATLIEHTGERAYYEPQIPALQAYLILASGRGSVEQAEALLIDAVRLWLRYGSPWMALRAAIALGSIALRTGRRKEARTRLAELYGRFSEGHELPQLRAARALVDELA